MIPSPVPPDADPLGRAGLAVRPPGRPIMRQEWHHLLFLHWEVPAEAIARLLPRGLGLEVDTFEGRAYVGLVPFTMRGVRPSYFPSVRGISNFHETNVRTYVVRRGRDPGVWFFSLDAASMVGCTLGRSVFGLPYFHARMVMTAEHRPGGLRLAYASQRFHAGAVAANTRIIAEVSAPVVPASAGTLESFLAERYLLYAAKGLRLSRGRVHHTPYPLQVAEVRTCEETALAAAGIERPDAAPIAHYASGVKVEVFRLEPVGPAMGGG